MNAHTGPGTASVVIVGAGFGGIAAAIALAQRGRRDFVILEAGDSVGGTWRDNTYPGCACDVPSRLYELEAVPNPSWSHVYGRQPEILDYLRRCCDAHGLWSHIRFGAEVRSARWDDAGRDWRLELTRGGVLRGRFLVLGTGPLRVPAMPELPGRDRFGGEMMHTARWRPDVALRGRRVAVIGTGASAIQVVPEVAKVAGHLTVYQRSPPWVLPREDRPIPERVRARWAAYPWLARLQRKLVYRQLELRGSALLGNRFLRPLAIAKARAHLERQVRDPDLRATLTPDYEMGCKRVLLSDDYYPALTRDNVELVPRAVTGFTESGLTDAAQETRRHDVVVYATGFDVGRFVAPMRVFGRAGVELAERWERSGARAYLGMFVPGFPNLSLLLGPNTGLGHNSVVLMIEAQVRYTLACLDRMLETPSEVTEAALASFDAEMQGRLAERVWTKGGCSSWYLDRRGRNVALWPGFVGEYQRRTRRPLWSAFAPARASIHLRGG